LCKSHEKDHWSKGHFPTSNHIYAYSSSKYHIEPYQLVASMYLQCSDLQTICTGSFILFREEANKVQHHAGADGESHSQKALPPISFISLVLHETRDTTGAQPPFSSREPRTTAPSPQQHPSIAAAPEALRRGSRRPRGNKAGPPSHPCTGRGGGGVGDAGTGQI
jgi:hypothetical protein